jgi:hypothetical protein
MGYSESFRQRYNLPSQVKIISFVGRFAPEKNPLLFDIFNPQNNKILFKGETKIEEFELDFFKDEVLQRI